MERVVDRVSGTVSAFCVFCAFGCAVGAASALRAGRRHHGKEKVYGSIPQGVSRSDEFSEIIADPVRRFVERFMETFRRTECTGCPRILAGHSRLVISRVGPWSVSGWKLARRWLRVQRRADPSPDGVEVRAAGVVGAGRGGQGGRRAALLVSLRSRSRAGASSVRAGRDVLGGQGRLISRNVAWPSAVRFPAGISARCRLSGRC